MRILPLFVAHTHRKLACFYSRSPVSNWIESRSHWIWRNFPFATRPSGRKEIALLAHPIFSGVVAGAEIDAHRLYNIGTRCLLIQRAKQKGRVHVIFKQNKTEKMTHRSRAHLPWLVCTSSSFMRVAPPPPLHTWAAGFCAAGIARMERASAGSREAKNQPRASAPCVCAWKELLCVLRLLGCSNKWRLELWNRKMEKMRIKYLCFLTREKRKRWRKFQFDVWEKGDGWW